MAFRLPHVRLVRVCTLVKAKWRPLYVHMYGSGKVS